MPITATLKQDWEMINADNDRVAVVTAGVHELERIENPFGHAAPWLVIKGTKIGQAEGAWRQWSDSKNEKWLILIKEDDAQKRSQA